MESISRRSFLAGSALAVGGWVFLPATGRAEGSVDPNRFVLISDTHVCGDRNAREHECNPDEMIQQAVKDILELAPVPAGVMVEVVQDGAQDHVPVAVLVKMTWRFCGVPVPS